MFSLKVQKSFCVSDHQNSQSKHCICSALSWHEIILFSFWLSLHGSPHRMIWLHLTLSSASSSLTPTKFTSSFTSAINLLFGPALDLLPGSSNPIIFLQIYPLSLLCTCLNHHGLAALTFSPKCLTCAVCLMYSFLILSILVSPQHFNL